MPTTPSLRGPRAGGAAWFDSLASRLVVVPSIATLSAVAPALAAEAVHATAPQAATSQRQQAGEESRQREVEETKRLTDLYLRNQSVFIRKGELMLELNTFYNQTSRQDLVPVTGGFALVPTTTGNSSSYAVEHDADGASHLETKNVQEENRAKEAEEAKRLTELYLRNQNVFLRKGELMLELDSFYNRNNQQQFAQVSGFAIPVNTTQRFFNTLLIARYGVLTDGLEVDLIAPFFVHAEVKTDAGVASVTQEEEGFGDVGAAVRYQAWYERGARPSLVIDFEGKSNTGGSGLTGTGTWNAGGGVTLIKTIDPVVLFARLGYTYTFGSHSRDLGNIVDYRIGMGFSLNDRVSFNMQLTGAYIGPSKFTGFGGAPGTGGGTGPVVFSAQHVELMNLIFATTIMVTKQLFVEPLVGVGLTEQSFTIVGVRLPYRF